MKSHSLNSGLDIRHQEAFQMALLSSGTREDIIAWLVWNDRNGVYTDKDSELEDYPPLTLESARDLMRKVLDES
ncbi:MAG: hypothetical protein ACKOAH_08355 [Pirellula sp.]